MVNRWILRVLASCSILAGLSVSAVSMGAPIAGADGTTTSCAGVTGTIEPWQNQCAIVNDPITYDREYFVLQAPKRTFLTRDQVLANAAQYRAQGFTQNFLWWAKIQQITPPANQLWTACGDNPNGNPRPVGQFCNTAIVSGAIGTDLSNRTIDVIGTQGGDWIALACGNFGYPVKHEDVYPTISGFKFNDLNRDGKYEPGEPGIGGITFTLTLVSSLVGNTPGEVATTVSKPDGSFTFPLSKLDEGPGTYRVTEQYTPNWPNTTSLTQTITVPEGAGSGQWGPTLMFGDRQEIPPVPVATPVSTDQSSSQGAQVTLNGTGSYSPTGSPITWTWTGPFGTATGSTPTVQMPPGTSTVTLTVSDGIESRSTQTTVTVYPPITPTSAIVTAVEGQPFSGPVATFTDPDPSGVATDYVASINWNDGSAPSVGSIAKAADGTFTVTGSHTYIDEGPYAPTVTVTDADVPYNTGTAVDQGGVGDALLSPAVQGTLTSVEGASLSGIVGTFSDANPIATARDFSATVAWGDGATSVGSVTENPDGTFSVSASHTYTEETTYSTKVSVVDDGGSSTSIGGTVVVSDAPLRATGVETATTNPLSNLTLATFTDANPFGTAGDFTATIDWGDGTTSSGTVTGPVGASSGPYSVSGSHTYSTLGFKTIKVHIVDDGGQTADVVDHVLIYAPSNFVVGDLSIGGFHQGAAANGPTVNFWGSQWWKKNTVSGDPAGAPASFKGYATTTTDSTFTSSPGNTPGEPATIPAYMGVLVTGSVNKSGSSISGSIVHVVIVQTDAGYAADPGHWGTGSVVWDLR